MQSIQDEKNVYDHESVVRSDDDVEIWAEDDPRMKRLLRKIDFRLITSLGLAYVVAAIDRTNLGNAAIAGLSKDLELIKNQYSIIALVFFPTYVLFQPLCTIVAKKLGPRNFLPVICAAWGVVMIGFGLVNKWTDLVALRIILGCFEAGLFPAAYFLLSTWYLRHEIAWRSALFYVSSCAAGGLGGLLAYAFSLMKGTAGKAGWRWIFIIEGILTVLLGFGLYFFIVDFPENAHKSFRFLTVEEGRIVNARIDRDRHDAHTPPWTAKEYFGSALDLKIWLFAFIFGGAAGVIYSVAYFLPTLLESGLGFAYAEAQCLTLPLYVFGAIFMLAECKLSDKYQMRALPILINQVLAIIGVSILGFTHIKYLRYFAAYLIVAGEYSTIPLTMTFQQNNIVGQWKRAFCSATMVGAGGIGGIYGSLVFRTQDKPEYHFGVYATLITASLVFLATCVAWLILWRENKKQEKEGKIICGIEGFRYTY